MEHLSIYAIIKYGMVAMLGAIVNAIFEYQDGKSKTWVDFIALFTIGSFSGLMFGIIALAVFPTASIYWHMMFIGAGSVLGREGLKVVSHRILGMARIALK